MATRTQAECLAAAGVILSRALRKVLVSDPREAAERAFTPGGPSVDELEEKVRMMQARARSLGEQAAA